MSVFTLNRSFSGLVLVASLIVAPTNLAWAQGGMHAKSTSSTAEIESGIRLLTSRDPAGAKLHFSAAVRADPKSADALTWRGIAENQLSQYAEADKDFEAALRINPTELPAHYNLALALIRTGQTDHAIEELKIVVKAHPGVLEPEYNLAILLEQKQATADAVEHLKAAYQAQENDAGVIQHLLVDLLTLARTDEAQPILKRLQTEAPAQTQMQVGKALLEAGFFVQAGQLLEDADTQKGTNPQLDLLLARAYLGSRNDFRAIDLLKPQSSADTTGEVDYLLGLAYADAGATQEAKSEFQQAITSNPSDARAFYHLGMLESENPGDLPAALGHLRTAIKLEPGNSAYSILLGRILLQHDNPREALSLLQRVHAEGQEAGERDLLLGIAQITVSGATQAVSTLERSVEEDPSLAMSHNMLGFCYLAQGDMAKAAASYAKASDLNPQSRIFAHGAAVAFDRSNDPGRAMVYAARAAALPAANGEDDYLIGKLLAKAGQNADAIRELNKAIILSPDSEESYYLLARTYMQTGDTAQAKESIAKLQSLKLKHAQSDTEARKSPMPITSSTLLQGAPTANTETGAP